MALPDKPLNRHKEVKTMNRNPGVYSAMRCYRYSSSTIIKLFTPSALHGDQYAMKIIRHLQSAPRLHVTNIGGLNHDRFSRNGVLCNESEFF